MPEGVAGVDWSGPGLPNIADFFLEVTDQLGDVYLDWSGPGLPSSGWPTQCISTTSTTSSSSTSTSTVDTDGEEVVMMQTSASGAISSAGDGEVDTASSDLEPLPPGGGDDPWHLTDAEAEELLGMGWPADVIENLAELLRYLRDMRDHTGAEAVSWALGEWGQGTVVADATIDLVMDVLYRRVDGVQETRPSAEGERGRLCVGMAGFQKVLRDFHCLLIQECMQGAWLLPQDLDDERLLSAGAVIRNDNSASALATARARARELLDRARRRHALPAGAPRDGSAAAAGDDAPLGGDDGDGDGTTLMQLTAAEEERLQRVGIDDTVRARLRQLLRQLCEQEDRGVGAEYRWGVAQVVEASIGAHVVARCVEAILEDRGRISASMTSWPAVRIPAHGALRSRVASWMNEFRWVVVQACLELLYRILRGARPAWEVSLVLVVRVGKHGRQLAGPGRVAVALVLVALPYLGVGGTSALLPVPSEPIPPDGLPGPGGLPARDTEGGPSTLSSLESTVQEDVGVARHNTAATGACSDAPGDVALPVPPEEFREDGVPVPSAQVQGGGVPVCSGGVDGPTGSSLLRGDDSDVPVGPTVLIEVDEGGIVEVSSDSLAPEEVTH